jgi:hypothetical protein
MEIASSKKSKLQSNLKSEDIPIETQQKSLYEPTLYSTGCDKEGNSEISFHIFSQYVATLVPFLVFMPTTVDMTPEWIDCSFLFFNGQWEEGDGIAKLGALRVWLS